MLRCEFTFFDNQFLVQLFFFRHLFGDECSLFSYRIKLFCFSLRIEFFVSFVMSDHCCAAQLGAFDIRIIRDHRHGDHFVLFDVLSLADFPFQLHFTGRMHRSHISRCNQNPEAFDGDRDLGDEGPDDDCCAEHDQPSECQPSLATDDNHHAIQVIRRLKSLQCFLTMCRS